MSAISCSSRSWRSASGGSRASAATPARRSAAALPERSSGDTPRAWASAASRCPLIHRTASASLRQ
eukprot:2024932-Pyramimonas_sp.AAC.1